MPRFRLPAALRLSRRAPPESLPPLPGTGDPPPSPRDLLLHSWAGRLFLAAASLKLVVVVVTRLAGQSGVVSVVSGAATIGLAVAVGYFVSRLFLLMKRRLLWRVRRKLILSYIFIGVVPALLIIAFFMLGAWVVSTNVSAYLFRDGYDDVVSAARQAAGAAAEETARTPSAASDTIARIHRGASQRHRSLSMAFVPGAPGAPGLVVAGEWSHLPEPPAAIPAWVGARGDGFSGTVAHADAAGDVELIVRAAAPVVTADRRLGYVVVDVPVDGAALDALYEATGVKGGTVRLGNEGGAGGAGAAGARAGGEEADNAALFGRGVTILDAYDWETGQVRRATISNSYALGELYEKLASAQSAQMGGVQLGTAILAILALVAILFLIIECVALVMGLALARSITRSVHELFTGTERVRHGDFTHRITVMSSDQLGELAGSFNQMIGSIEVLLQTAAEKKRLEEELRIARQIQMSLLPRGPLEMPGLAVTALCVPAREVGGDYYDFFPMRGERLGVLIADVSGKGTSAALYMAELKGLVLSLSQIYESPRQLLLEVNRIISENLDSRSFITMTYAVLDLAAGTMTYARAGHTPLMYMRHASPEGARVQVLVPNGMVLGLRLPGAEGKFEELLEEDTLELDLGDVVVLFTDGITEAMNVEQDLFGDARLGQLIEEHGHLESGELRERILREIEAFVGSADQHDDMTMVLIKIQRAFPSRPLGARVAAERAASALAGSASSPAGH
jgi:sigma-B regulation protein RsbU (phosphoserine phosphatase)